MISDNELLRHYVVEGSETAFAELVQRHLSLVYSAALRRTDGQSRRNGFNAGSARTRLNDTFDTEAAR